LVEIHEELDKKSSVKSGSREGSVIKGYGPQSGDATVSRLYEKYAIWFWRSNNISNNGLVVWDAESANTEPNSFIWDRYKSGFILVQGGLYEISFGFFGVAKPHIEVLLNDSPILASRVDKSQERYSGHFEVMHSSGNVTGLTCLEYVILPPKAKLNIRLKGNAAYEGFLLIKKL
jgi:hypothetical protein